MFTNSNPSLKLDHFVVHIDNDEAILNKLKQQIEPLGFPFEPTWGKGTSGFKAANIWIDRQYFEIIRLLDKNGGGWTRHWVEQYNQGKRGIYCIFLVTDKLDDVSQSIKTAGIEVQGPERISFKALFGLIKKTLPWRLVYLPKIPGTSLEIGFIQYDPDPKDRIKQFLVPNSDEKGIVGIPSATIFIPLNDEAIKFLTKIFPLYARKNNELLVHLKNGTLTFKNSDRIRVELIAETSNAKLQGNSFSFENVLVKT